MEHVVSRGGSPRWRLLTPLASVLLAQVLLAPTATADTTPPPAPTAVQAAAGPGKVGLLWPHVAVADRAGYAVYRSTSLPVPTSGTPRNGSALLKDRQFVDNGTNGTTYHYVVVTVDTSGNRSTPSQPVQVRPVAPDAPSGDPITWATRAAAAIGRAEASGTASGGRLYVFGGQYDGVKQTARSDVYDPATDTWERLPDLPELITHAPVVDVDGELWLLGGYLGLEKKDSTAHVWIYDRTSRTYRAGPPLPAPRGAGGAALVGRQLHYFGGAVRKDSTGAETEDFADHWVLDVEAGTGWTVSVPVPNPRNHVAAVALGTDVYLIGGQHGEFEKASPQTQVDAYSTTSGTWRRVADLPVARGHISASAFVLDGRIVAVGGSTVGAEESDTVYEYDPGGDSWRTRTRLPAARKSPVAHEFGGDVVVSGGRDAGVATTTTWRGTTGQAPPPGDLGTWSSAAPLPAQRLDASGAEVAGKVYVVGGKDAGGRRSDLFAFDPVSGTWDTSLPPLPGVAVENPAAVAWRGALYVFGGSTAAFSGSVRTAYRFDPASRAWTQLAPMRVGRAARQRWWSGTPRGCSAA
jgi:N-acetylneuraminic acid mutarotase